MQSGAVAAKLPPVGFQALLIADSPNVAAAIVPALVQFGVRPGSVQILGTELWDTSLPCAPSRPCMVRCSRRFPMSNSVDLQDATAASSVAPRRGWPVWDIMPCCWPTVSPAAGQPFPRELLASTEGYAGIDGAFRFGTSSMTERALEVRQVGSGTVSAAALSFAR